MLNKCKSELSIVIVICFFFALVACQKRPTWQEQYDLGMRYLTESNYEEAILAFTAAIEIDPNQPDAYVYLIQTYLATGDVEKAEATRLQGYEATGNIRLGQSVSSGWIIYDDNIPFEQRITYRLFDALSAEQQKAIQALLAAIQTDERETVRELLLTSGLSPQLCTTLDGYKINVSIMQRETLGEDAYQTFIEQYYRQAGADIDDIDNSFRHIRSYRIERFGRNRCIHGNWRCSLHCPVNGRRNGDRYEDWLLDRLHTVKAAIMEIPRHIRVGRDSWRCNAAT